MASTILKLIFRYKNFQQKKRDNFFLLSLITSSASFPRSVFGQNCITHLLPNHSQGEKNEIPGTGFLRHMAMLQRVDNTNKSTVLLESTRQATGHVCMSAAVWGNKVGYCAFTQQHRIHVRLQSPVKNNTRYSYRQFYDKNICSHQAQIRIWIFFPTTFSTKALQFLLLFRSILFRNMFEGGWVVLQRFVQLGRGLECFLIGQQ